MNILITGSSGFIGSCLVKDLQQNHSYNSLYLLDKTEPNYLLDKNSVFVKEDICNKKKIQSLLNDLDLDVVIHLAALHYIPYCEENPSEAIDTNVLGTINLFSNLDKETRFINFSSAAVYAPENIPHSEKKSKLLPMDIYGMTKLYSENFLSQLSSNKNIECVSIRLFNAIGIGETNPHLIPELVKQLKLNVNKIEVGNTFPKRDYIDIRDISRAITELIFNNTNYELHDIYNIGSGKAHSVEEVLSTLIKISGVDCKVIQDKTRMRSVDRPYLVSDISKFNSITGWEPKISFEESMRFLYENPQIRY